MASIGSKDTKPEKTVRSLLHKLGYRFRLHRPDLPGKPDLVFPSRRKVIFVNGCFWHMHDCRKGTLAPLTNAAFWQAKRRRTAARDQETLKLLAADGWEAYIIWECELTDFNGLRERLEHFLIHENRINY